MVFCYELCASSIIDSYNDNEAVKILHKPIIHLTSFDFGLI